MVCITLKPILDMEGDKYFLHSIVALAQWLGIHFVTRRTCVLDIEGDKNFLHSIVVVAQW
jgi:hypothetical protein